MNSKLSKDNKSIKLPSMNSSFYLPNSYIMNYGDNITNYGRNSVVGSCDMNSGLNYHRRDNSMT